MRKKNLIKITNVDDMQDMWMSSIEERKIVATFFYINTQQPATMIKKHPSMLCSLHFHWKNVENKNSHCHTNMIPRRYGAA